MSGEEHLNDEGTYDAFFGIRSSNSIEYAFHFANRLFFVQSVEKEVYVTRWIGAFEVAILVINTRMGARGSGSTLELPRDQEN